jgi:hypothetical protein
MALDFFRVDKGLQLDESTTYLTGNGVPGTTADTNGVVVGSVYTNTADGAIYTKYLAGSGVDKWQRLASETYVNNAMGAAVSWREPAIVRDNTSTSVPSGTAGNTIIVDGVSIGDGGRVLFSNISGGGGSNVYIYNQTTGGFVEDVNSESSGDAVFIQQGTDAGKTFIFNGTAWVQSDQSSLDELGFIRSFIGKATAGNVPTNFTSNNFVTDGDDLLTAISDLDAELGPNLNLGNFVSPATTINANIQELDRVVGPNFGVTNHLVTLATSSLSQNLVILDGRLGANLILGNYVTAGQAAFPAIQALDIAIGANLANGNYVLAANKVQQNIQALDNAIGANVANGEYILAANPVQQNIQALDTALAEVTKTTSATNVTTATLFDAVPAADVDVLHFYVVAQETANPANKYATQLYVLCNGAAVDYNKYGTLRLGSTILGLQISAVLDGTDVKVQVSSTTAVDVKVRRGTVVE